MLEELLTRQASFLVQNTVNTIIPLSVLWFWITKRLSKTTHYCCRAWHTDPQKRLLLLYGGVANGRAESHFLETFTVGYILLSPE